MRIFALETDINKIKQKFCHSGESILLSTPYHTFSFFFSSIRELFITIALFVVGIIAFIYDLPMGWTLGVLLFIWVVFVFFNLLKAYVDWLYDFIIVTDHQVILVDQTSIYKHEIRPIHVDNIGAITTSTQFWNIFPFGILKIHLKEGLGGDTVMLKYVPHAEEVAATITRAVSSHQSRSQTSAQRRELSGIDDSE
ncbi:MAG: hypothetical protein KC680_02020 [Candidatus Peregrinibacteria bacterium]|nr:hypothetical protein [Candidatus Peregrinibacteria bacterium]MCB9808140.1 hypothetical protein [Candidatus Peribacteria bacterium]